VSVERRIVTSKDDHFRRAILGEGRRGRQEERSENRKSEGHRRLNDELQSVR
jgi:hypothetical protein